MAKKSPFIRPYKPMDREATAFICRATLPPSLAGSAAGTMLAPYLWTHQYTFLSPDNCFVLDDGEGRCVGYVIGCPDVFAFAESYPRFVREVLDSHSFRDEVRGSGSGFKVRPPQMEALEPFWVADEAAAAKGEEGRKAALVVNENWMLQMARSPHWLLLEGVEGKAELASSHRATMHIDLLPEFQGRGFGALLIQRFVASVRHCHGRSIAMEPVAESGPQAGEEEERTHPIPRTRVLDHGAGIHIGIAGENDKVVGFYERCGFKVHPGGEREGNVWMVYDLNVPEKVA